MSRRIIIERYYKYVKDGKEFRKHNMPVGKNFSNQHHYYLLTWNTQKNSKIISYIMYAFYQDGGKNGCVMTRDKAFYIDGGTI